MRRTRAQQEARLMIMQVVSCIEFHESRRRMARSFTRGLALAALSLVSLILTGCGDGGVGGPVTSATPVVSRFVYVANQADDTVSIYALDAGSGQLRSLGYVAAGTTPFSVTIDASGRFAYVANGSSNNISSYTINATTGALTPVAGSPFPAGIGPVSVTVDARARFAYVANLGANVSAYTINATTGALTPVAGSPFPAGDGPRGVTVDARARFVYVGNFSSDNVSAYTINATTGALTPVAGSPFPAGTGP